MSNDLHLNFLAFFHVTYLSIDVLSLCSFQPQCFCFILPSAFYLGQTPHFRLYCFSHFIICGLLLGTDVLLFIRTITLLRSSSIPLSSVPTYLLLPEEIVIYTTLIYYVKQGPLLWRDGICTDLSHRVAYQMIYWH